MRAILKLLALATLIPSTSTASPSGGQRLADFRRVVVAPGAPKVQEAAAEELAHYVELISGRPIEVVRAAALPPDAPGLSFFVGEGAARAAVVDPLGPWKDEEWALLTVPRGLVLAGQDEEGNPWAVTTSGGTLLAVYTLLDDLLGVRWLWPGPFGEHVPRRPDATLPEVRLRRTPAFSIRILSVGASGYHRREFTDAVRRWQRRTRQGWTRSAAFGHSWDATFGGANGPVFCEHPEWFALVGGKRRPPQMCTSNPAVIAKVVERALDSTLDVVNISPSDGGGFCECEACRKLDVPGVFSYDNRHVQLSDRIFTYANEVARRVREKDPRKAVGIHAYTYYNRPPLTIKALEPNLYVSFVFQAAAHRNPENLKEWRDTVRGWQKLGAKLIVREGWGNHYTQDLPYLHYRQILASLSEARAMGFVGVYGEGTKCFATQAPNYWAATRMMADPDRDPAAVMADFYASAYGPAAAEMEAYFETYAKALDANWAKLDRNVDTTAVAYANLICSWRRLIPEDVVAAADERLKAAERLAPEGEVANRLRLHRLGQTYTATMLELLESYRKLAELGVQLDWFSTLAKTRREAPEERAALLRRAYELGEEREGLLLAQRDWAGPNEGVYAFNHEKGLRSWHAAVKAALKIEKPSAVTPAALRSK